MRERMEAHRANPACAGCHQLMDPLGFALENFDAVGAWRTREAGAPIDASGAAARRHAGRRRRRAAAGAADATRTCSSSTLTEKLLTYALGRGLQHYDMPVVRDDRPRRRREQDYRFSSLVLGIVKSAPFQMRQRKATRVRSAER